METFWKRVKKIRGGCWLWIGKLMPNGYAKLTLGSVGVYAHRLSWEMANGEPVPEGMYVCHRCDVRNCVNPDHLFIGTPQDNANDCKRKGRSKKPSRMSPEQLWAIRNDSRMGVIIAKEYGISAPLVSLIKSGKRCNAIGHQ